VEVPEEARQWLTGELQTLLAAIRGGQVAKKRVTVIKLACAVANRQPRRTVFGQADTCSDKTWYTRWQYQPEVKVAFEACCTRALAWADEETAALEAHYRRQRRRTMAQYAAQAPAALAAVMADAGQRGADRISAANALLTWADPEVARKAQPQPPPASGGEQVVYVGVTAEELAAIENALREEATRGEDGMEG
jgi:hypothetical protein